MRLFCLAGKPVKWGMAASTLTACALAVTLQGVSPAALLKTLVEKGITLIAFELREPSLHEIFVEKVGDVHEEA